MISIAQTNLQLFNQLCRARWPVDDLRRIRAAYELAMALFSGQYRANGKPFLAHLVGTASVLAALRQSPAVVAAGLLHSTFEFGDFGDGVRGVTPARWQRLANRAGADAAALVVLYQGLSRVEAMQQMTDYQSGQYSEAERTVLLMHLADTLEEHADGGVHYAPSKQAFLQDACRTDVAKQTLAAIQRLGLTEFCSDIEAIFADAQCYSPPEELICHQGGSYLIAPESMGERPSVRWRRTYFKLFREAHRLVSRLGVDRSRRSKRAAA